MWSYRLLFLLLLIISGLPMSLPAQTLRHSFTSFGPKDGLPSSDITTLFQDSRNYLWIGHAAGASRYDGNQFQNFLFSGNARLGRVYAIREDGEGYVWIGAEGGLFVYAAKQIRHIQFDKPVPVYSLFKNDSGAMWMATSDGPAFLSLEKLRLIRKIEKLNVEQETLSAWLKKFPGKNLARDISIDKSGTSTFPMDTKSIV